jgi:hypothetical protein
MTLPNLQAGIGVIGLNSIIEKVQGWTLTVNQLTATSLTVQAVSNYQPNSLSSQLSFMKIRYIVSTRPNLDINFTQINFMSKIIVIKVIKMFLMFTPKMIHVHIFDVEKH